MFTSLLVANRGEIACRIFRTAARMGIRTIAVYSDADASAAHVAMADNAVRLGPAKATDSYLAIDKVIAAAKATDAEAIHPGYGFLSENSRFARACEAAGIIFVGPSPAAIDTMGSKMASKQLMEAAGVPVLPGYHGDNQDPDFLAQQAVQVGFPLLIKASAGGGGKGMRLVEHASEFAEQLAGAKREASAAFGDDKVLLERYLTAPKHIEVQLMADTHGNTVHLFERDCSVQRRHQKVIEEAPAPTVGAQLRNKLGQTAIMAAKKVDYVGAGTVEFIAEGDEFFFMEMNTRLQVEHPVTEAITSLDLVELQLRVAAGEPLGLTQAEIELHGHAIEVRLYAENPAKNFLPSTGKLCCFEIPDDIRVDTGVGAEDEVSAHYDPMLAKLIAHGNTRAEAIAQLIQALRNAWVAGVDHNLGYLAGVLAHKKFAAGDYTTGLAEQIHDDVIPDQRDSSAALAALHVLGETLQSGNSAQLPWSLARGFRNNLPPCNYVHLNHAKQTLDIRITPDQLQIDNKCIPMAGADYDVATGLCVWLDGRKVSGRVVRDRNTLYVMQNGHAEKFLDLTDDLSRYQNQLLSSGGIVAPMPGQVIAVNVAAGDKVKQGQVLAVVEAMKMEHSVLAPKKGIVEKVSCNVGDRVEEGVTLIELGE